MKRQALLAISNNLRTTIAPAIKPGSHISFVYSALLLSKHLTNHISNITEDTIRKRPHGSSYKFRPKLASHAICGESSSHTQGPWNDFVRHLLLKLHNGKAWTTIPSGDNHQSCHHDGTPHSKTHFTVCALKHNHDNAFQIAPICCRCWIEVT